LEQTEVVAGKSHSEHDLKIANKYVYGWSDLYAETNFSKQTYLLDIEREASLSLCTEEKH
jgi:3-hydroxyacyl-CoA dehydrogenase